MALQSFVEKIGELGAMKNYIISPHLTEHELAANRAQAKSELRQILEKFAYMRWDEIERIYQKYGDVTVKLVTEGHGTEIGHLQLDDLLTVRMLLAASSPQDTEMGTCDLVSKPHRRDHCGEAWRPLRRKKVKQENL